MNKTGRNIILVFLALILLAGSFSGGILIGWLIPSKTTLENNLSTELTATSVPATASGSSSTSSETSQLFKPFWEAWDIVHEQYVDQPVNDTALMQGAIRGMMEALGDKHSSYLDPDEYKTATEQLSGEYQGIGAYVDATGKYLTIVSPIKGSPADAAGLKAGDEIIAVDGKDQTGIDPTITLKSVKGPADSEVKLTIHRPDPDSTFDVTIVRKTISPEADHVSGKMLDGGLAYVIIPTFGDNTTEELKTELTTLLAQNPKGLIVDLRYNSGGYLQTAVEVASQFLDSGVVLYEQEGNGNMNTYNVIPGGLATKIPLVVLVNEGSASASEITAGAIQDHGRGKLVGVTTYGKGSVQNWVELSDSEGVVRVTIARWLTPNKRQINEVGLTPDYVVELPKEDTSSTFKDTQLEKAEEILLSGN
jgi:carboxyl-terminal processing protease